MTALMIAIKKGYKEIAKLLLANQNIDVNVTIVKPFNYDTISSSALILAAQKGYKDIVELILSNSNVDLSMDKIFLLLNFNLVCPFFTSIE